MKQTILEVVIAFALMWVLIGVAESFQLTQTIAHAVILK